MRVPSGWCTWAVRTENCAIYFSENFAEKSSLFKSRILTVRHCRPDGRTSAASNFHIRLSYVRTMGMSVRTANLQHTISIYTMRASRPWKAGVQTVEVESVISLTVERASRPRLTVVRTMIFELRFLPYVWVRPDGNPRRPDGWSNLPLNWTWKESEADRSLRGVQTGCWNVRTDASWNSSFSKQWRSGRKCMSSGQMMLGLSSVRTVWHFVRTEGIVDRWASGRDTTSSGRLTGSRNLLTCKQCRIFWHHYE